MVLLPYCFDESSIICRQPILRSARHVDIINIYVIRLKSLCLSCIPVDMIHSLQWRHGKNSGVFMQGLGKYLSDVLHKALNLP